MPTPILEIPIDDKDFKAFLDVFKGYQEALKQQPQMWDGVNKGIRDTVETSSEFAETLSAQISAMEKMGRVEDEQERKRSDARRRKRKEQAEDAQHEQEAANRRRRATDQVREYSRNISNVVKSGGAWAGRAAEGALGATHGGAAGLFGAAGGILSGIPLIGGLLGGIATAGYQVMANMHQDRQQAHGLGVNVQTLQGWKTALGPYLPAGAAEQLLGTVSEAQASPGGGGLFGRFGIKNYNNRGVSDLSAEMLTKAQGYLKSHPGAQGLWGAKSLFGGAMDTGTLRTLQDMSPEELQKAIASMKKFADNNKSAEEAATKATNDLAAAEQTATTLMDKFGGGIASATDQVTGAMKDLFNVIQPYLGALGIAKKVWADPKKELANIHHVQDTDNVHKLWNSAGGAIGKAYDTVVAGIKSAIPITSMDMSSLFSFGRNTVIPQTRAMGIGRDSRGLIGSSAMGMYQITGETIRGHSKFLEKRFGKDWMKHKFDSEFQEALAEQIFNENKHGDLARTWTSLKDHRAGAYAGMSWSQVRGIIAKGESGGLPASDTGHVAKAVAHAVKKAVAGHHGSPKHGTTVKIKTQQKPGSDVTVSARQMAGR